MSTITLQRESSRDVLSSSELRDQLLQCRLCGVPHRGSMRYLNVQAALTK